MMKEPSQGSRSLSASLNLKEGCVSVLERRAALSWPKWLHISITNKRLAKEKVQSTIGNVMHLKFFFSLSSLRKKARHGRGETNEDLMTKLVSCCTQLDCDTMKKTQERESSFVALSKIPQGEMT